MARTDVRFRTAYNALLDLCEELYPEHSLPAENALADRIGVSRTVVRAGLQKLDDDRIIRWDGRDKRLLRKPVRSDRLPTAPIEPAAEDLETLFFDWILRFDVPAGTPLNVARLSRDFGTPPHRLQEFLAGLSRFGLVERRPRGGWTLLGFTTDFAVELSEFRRLLELDAVRHLVTLPDSHRVWVRLDAMEAEHRLLETRIEANFNDFSKLDERFHALINSVVTNRFAAEFQKIISLIFHYHYTWDKTGEKDRNAGAITEHLAVIEALRSRDPELAEAAARRHLESSQRNLLASLRTATVG